MHQLKCHYSPGIFTQEQQDLKDYLEASLGNPGISLKRKINLLKDAYRGTPKTIGGKTMPIDKGEQKHAVASLFAPGGKFEEGIVDEQGRRKSVDDLIKDLRKEGYALKDLRETFVDHAGVVNSATLAEKSKGEQASETAGRLYAEASAIGQTNAELKKHIDLVEQGPSLKLAELFNVDGANTIKTSFYDTGQELVIIKKLIDSMGNESNFSFEKTY